MELKKLLMNSSCKEGLCTQPSSPKTEGAGKKGTAAQQQVCGRKFIYPRLLRPRICLPPLSE